MFWLSFIPQTTIFWIIHGLLITGLIVYLGARFAGPWKFIVSPIALIVVLCAIFFEGFYYSQKEYLRQIEEYQNKVRDAEEKSKETNTLIKTKPFYTPIFFMQLQTALQTLVAKLRSRSPCSGMTDITNRFCALQTTFLSGMAAHT